MLIAIIAVIAAIALSSAFAIALGKAIKRADQLEQPLHQRRVSDRDGFAAARHSKVAK